MKNTTKQGMDGIVRLYKTTAEQDYIVMECGFTLPEEYRFEDGFFTELQDLLEKYNCKSNVERF